MQSYFDPKQKVKVVSIAAGERYVSAEGEVIATLLGSCVAVTLYDPLSKIGGMNHFMLPKPPHKNDALHFESGKYGIEAIVLLIDDLLQLGARRQLLVAKVFGGGHVLGIGNPGHSGVPYDNVSFALSYLKKENITVEAMNVGGYHGRKVFFFTANGKIRLRKIAKKSRDRSEPLGTPP